MTGKINKLLLIISFLLIIGCIGVGTLYRGWSSIYATIQQGFRDTKSVDVNVLENNLKDNLVAKNYLIECSGITQKMLGQHLSKDNQFYQDSNGIMHLRRYDADYSGLIDSTKYLAAQLEKREIPLLVCQIAERADYGDKYSKFIDGDSLNYIEPLKEALVGSEAIYLDYKELFQNVALTVEEIFFKTDVHYTTNAEFIVLQEIIETLESKAGLQFDNKDIILNLDNYLIEAYPLFGNLGYTTGELYAGMDEFIYYLPKFDTRMCLQNSPYSVMRYGSFEDVCINELQKQTTYDPRAYRIVDYMQYSSPCYTITNELIEDNNILVIGCSMCMRTNAYLTLLCHSVTVLDPRYFGDKDYLSETLKNDFDAVIVYPSFNLIDGIGGYNAEIKTVNIEKTENGLYNIVVQILNNGSMPWYYNKQIKVNLWVNDSDFGLRAELPSDMVLEPGQIYEFVFENVNRDIIQQKLFIQMLREGMFYFGENEYVTTIPEKLPDYKAKILSYNISNKALVVEVLNNSNSIWNDKNRIKCCIWVDGQDIGIRAYLEPLKDILPGESVFFRFDNIANLERHDLSVQMLQEGITYFGEREKIEIIKE